jgi:hypothetical protein
MAQPTARDIGTTGCVHPAREGAGGLGKLRTDTCGVDRRYSESRGPVHSVQWHPPHQCGCPQRVRRRSGHESDERLRLSSGHVPCQYATSHRRARPLSRREFNNFAHRCRACPKYRIVGDRAEDMDAENISKIQAGSVIVVSVEKSAAPTHDHHRTVSTADRGHQGTWWVRCRSQTSSDLGTAPRKEYY